MTIHFKRHRHTDEKQDEYMSCHDLRPAQTTKTTTNKTKTIQDYLGGSSVQKSISSRQLRSSLQLGLMS